METELTRAVQNLNWKVQPTFVQGAGAPALFKAWQLGEIVSKNPYLNRYTFDEQAQVMKNSSPLMNGRLDSILLKSNSGVRVATLPVLYSPEGRELLAQGFYGNPPALILRGNENQGYSRNTPLIKQLAEIVEEENKKLEFPLFISGFDFKLRPEDKEGYGLQIVKRADFIAISDDRYIASVNNGKTFNEVDATGPKFVKGGKYTFYAHDNATLSRVGVYSDGDLNSSDDNLDSTGDNGRVVLYADEVGARDFLRACLNNLDNSREEQIAQVNEWYEQAKANAPFQKQ